MITGGEKRSGKGYFVEPTIFTDIRPDMKIVSLAHALPATRTHGHLRPPPQVQEEVRMPAARLCRHSAQ